MDRCPGSYENNDRTPWTFEEMCELKIHEISETPSFIFLWCGSGGIGLNQGRQLLKKWGFKRCEVIAWLKTNKKQMNDIMKPLANNTNHNTNKDNNNNNNNNCITNLFYEHNSDMNIITNTLHNNNNNNSKQQIMDYQMTTPISNQQTFHTLNQCQNEQIYENEGDFGQSFCDFRSRFSHVIDEQAWVKKKTKKNVPVFLLVCAEKCVFFLFRTYFLMNTQ